MSLPLILVGMGASALANYFGNKQASDAAKKNAEAYREASAESLAAYKDFYDKAFGEGSYNEQLQDLGSKAADEYYALLKDPGAWNRYVDGVKAYQAPEEFSFTAQDLMNDPSYQFRLQQGQDALAQNQVAGGLNLSGAAAKQMNDYSQNVASTEYANAYNRAYNQFNNDRNFDYTKWLNESKQYYENLSRQLSGLDNVNKTGITANTNQANALQGLAGATGNNAAQNAAATAMANNADASTYADLIKSIGNVAGYGIANMGTAGDTINPISAPTNWGQSPMSGNNVWNGTGNTLL